MDEFGPWEVWKAEAIARGYTTRGAFHTASGYSEALNASGKQVGLFNHGKKLGNFTGDEVDESTEAK